MYLMEYKNILHKEKCNWLNAWEYVDPENIIKTSYTSNFYLQPVKPEVTSEMSNSQHKGIYCKRCKSQFRLIKQTLQRTPGLL